MIKEIRLRPQISDHDLLTKLTKAQKFIGNGAKLKFTVMFRGREMSRIDVGFKLLERVAKILEDVADGVMVTAQSSSTTAKEVLNNCTLSVNHSMIGPCKILPPLTPVRLLPSIAGRVPVKFAAGKFVRLAPDPLNGLLTEIFPEPLGVSIVSTLIVLALIYP